ncbi:MAG: peptidylprolyl isomerase [Deltaproteobacteria bacterium]|nr:peptidylprolyl isomerase [Deltaproteobacteria bacterium]
MAEAKLGDKVRVHYTGLLDDGTVFDTSVGREPFDFTIGENTVIPGFENAVVGMKVGDKKTISIPPGDAYGEYLDDLVVVINRSQIPPEIDAEVGMVLQVKSENGTATYVTVTDITDDAVTLDGNHPLAGKSLTFEIELLEIVA